MVVSASSYLKDVRRVEVYRKKTLDECCNMAGQHE